VLDQHLTRRKEYSSKGNFISQLLESTNAKFRVPNVDIFGKAKAINILVMIGNHG
jgi:hypothetical protein